MHRSRAPSSPDPGSPTPERLRRSVFVVGPAVASEHGPARAGSRVHRALSSLERLVRSGSIEPRQAIAGIRLRDDYELGPLGAREPASGSAGTTGWFYAEAQLAATRRYKNALNALGPTGDYVVLLAIMDLTISDIARLAQQNRQQVAGILKIGLTVLADRYERYGRLTPETATASVPGNRPPLSTGSNT